MTRKIHNSTYYHFVKGMSDDMKGRLMALEPIRIGGDFEDGLTKCTIALVDVNKNGKYNDKIDGLNIAEYQSDSIQSCYRMLSASLDEGYLFIQVGNRYFEPTEIDEKGNYIKIRELFNPENKPNLKLFDWKLPDLNFELLDGSHKNFHEFLQKDKYLYIEIWGMWCKPCWEASDTLRNIYEDYKDKLQIISLHHGGSQNVEIDLTQIKEYVKKKKILWINGISTDEINWELMQTGYPYGILINSEGKVLKLELHPLNLREYLEKNIFHRK